MTTNLRWPHEVPVASPERLESYAPAPLPEPPRSQADRLNDECLQRIRRAICRDSHPDAGDEAREAIKRGGGGRSHGRVLQPIRRTEGAA